MKDYGVKESWSKDFVLHNIMIDWQSFRNFDPIVALDDGLIFVFNDSRFSISHCDPGLNWRLRNVYTFGFSGTDFRGISHVPSLLSLKNVAKGENFKLRVPGISFSEIDVATVAWMKAQLGPMASFSQQDTSRAQKMTINLQINGRSLFKNLLANFTLISYELGSVWIVSKEFKLVNLEGEQSMYKEGDPPMNREGVGAQQMDLVAKSLKIQGWNASFKPQWFAQGEEALHS
ncbi:hypothetical protein RHMOL_Rhmol04G0068300 [Rhododendron molle]|uniref:Uncharacterized protein n=1 Tax=Rhododendron molle TaxID=49168 RepID=A0ACC0NY52_RHOML|nr:hypothetical protein RHMOL_Rhmol04G0068300 [Rhododendron molle]